MRGIGELLNKLQKVKTLSDKSFMACCPAHADKTPSLHISLKGETILLKCQAGCQTSDIVQTLGLEMSDLFIKEDKPVAVAAKEKIVAEYDYKDEQGNIIYQVVRFEPKNFRQRHKNNSGEWVWNMDGVKRVLYHLSDLYQEVITDTIYIVEGEKDADNLWKWGKVATTSPGGASSWHDDYADCLKGKRVVIIPDKDGPGFAYARQVANSLIGKAREVKVIILPGDKVKDVTDWLDAGGDISELDKLEQGTSILESPPGLSIERTITGYTFSYPGLTIVVRRVDVHKDGRVTGEITVNTPSVKLLPSTQFNFSAARTRKELANDLRTKSTEFDWNDIVKTLCDVVQERARTGEPGQIIEANDDIVTPPAYILEPLMMEGVPSVIYGDKGARKTSLCLALIGCIALGWADNPFGFAVDPQPHSVAFLDWESNWDLTRYNILRLRKGMGFPYFKFAYRRCHFPLADDLEATQTFMAEHKCDVMVLDSLGAACGGDLFKPEPALRFFSALQQLPAPTSLIIAQNSKNDDNKKTIFGSAYFTYYSRNIFELRRSDKDESQTDMSLCLYHKEGNYSKRYKPIGLHVTDSDDSLAFEPEEIKVAEFSERVRKTLRLNDFLKTGDKHVSAIASYLDMSENSCRVLLSREKKKGNIANKSPGVWSMTQQTIT